jgi:hypothetical protein
LTYNRGGATGEWVGEGIPALENLAAAFFDFGRKYVSNFRKFGKIMLQLFQFQLFKMKRFHFSLAS